MNDEITLTPAQKLVRDMEACASTYAYSDDRHEAMVALAEKFLAENGQQAPPITLHEITGISSARMQELQEDF